MTTKIDGAKVRRLMQEKAMGMDDLAWKLGCSPEVLKIFLDNGVAATMTARNMASAMGVTIVDITMAE